MDNEMSVLIADDSDYVRETLKYRLELERDISVHTTRDGLQTLKSVRALRPDVVLLDVMMPGLNGYRVSRAIREDASLGAYAQRVTIILVTARDLSSDPERERMFQDFSGADAVIYKPFDLDALVEKVVRAWIDFKPRMVEESTEAEAFTVARAS